MLIEKSLKGWKELEYEVVRDAADNVIICCNMEVRRVLLGRTGREADLGGPHAELRPARNPHWRLDRYRALADALRRELLPVRGQAQKLTRAGVQDEYHMLRSAAIKIVRHVGVVGECNVQYALNPNKREYMVIEVRSSPFINQC